MSGCFLDGVSRLLHICRLPAYKRKRFARSNFAANPSAFQMYITPPPGFGKEGGKRYSGRCPGQYWVRLSLYSQAQVYRGGGGEPFPLSCQNGFASLVEAEAVSGSNIRRRPLIAAGEILGYQLKELICRRRCSSAVSCISFSGPQRNQEIAAGAGANIDGAGRSLMMLG